MKHSAVYNKLKFSSHRKNLKQKPKWCLGFVARSCYCVSFRWRARPCVWCVAIRIHALGELFHVRAWMRVHAAPFLVALTWVVIKSFLLTAVHCRRLCFEAPSCYTACPSPACAFMRRRARPCTSIRVHAVQCAPMRLLVAPLAYTATNSVTNVT